MASNRTFEDLDLSKDEVKRLSEALKDEKFRKMFVEYAEEISDPENRRKAEAEIAMMENERGMNVQFIHPEPGYVMKTSVNGSRKAFINICQNDKIEKPNSRREKGADGKTGLMWQIPHSFAPPKEDHDKAKQKCEVFDVVFHPDTYRMAMKNDRFKKLVEDTALDGIETQFSVKLDRKNIRYPKLKFKGMPTATVIREKMPNAPSQAPESNDILDKMPYPYDKKSSSEKAKEKVSKEDKKIKNIADESKFTIPKYTITHRSELDMSEYTNAPDSRPSTRPKELVIKIELPLLTSAAQASLDIFERKLLMESVTPATYKLDLSLPFRVNDDEGSAKFDKAKRILTVTLPVIEEPTPSLATQSKKEGEESVASADKEPSDPAPLIEVLSETVENGIAQDAWISDVQEQNGHDAHLSQENRKTAKFSFPKNVKWVLPDYQFSQDNETVSFVLKVQSVKEKSVNFSSPTSNTAIIQFMSLGSGGFPIYFGLYIEFLEECRISSEHCSVDVSDDNVVLLILKDKSYRGLWDSFKIGTDESNLQEKEFLTESNLQREILALDEAAANEANIPFQGDSAPGLSVVEMNEKKLTIEIKPKKKQKAKKKDSKEEEEEEEEEEYDPPSSAEIEVVHKRPAPYLHSILKQRTLSESSEDQSNLGIEPESPRSGPEDNELSSSFSKRRSVSFNSHVDHASFKPSASVSSMGPVLKSKRRRERKREERKKGRTRKTSGGTSSSEECQTRESISDSYSMSEEEADMHNKRVGLTRAESDPGPVAVEDLDEVVTADELLSTKASGHGKDQGSGDAHPVTANKESLDFRTNSSSGNGDVCVSNVVAGNASANEQEMAGGEKMEDETSVQQSSKNKKIVSEIKDKLAGVSDQSKKNAEENDSDDDFVDAVSSISEEPALKEGFNKSSINVLHSESNNSCDKTSSTQGKDDDAGRASSKSKYDAVEERKPEKVEKSDVETMLSWEDGPVNGEEHVTECAVQFTNSLVFDLDVD